MLAEVTRVENSSREGTFSNAISKAKILTEDVIIVVSLVFLNLHTCISTGFILVLLLLS